MTVDEALARPQLYLKAIDALYKKQSNSTFGDAVFRQNVEALYAHRRRWAREIAKLVGQGRYEFSPAQRRLTHVGGKLRWLYKLELNDQIFSAVLAGLLNQALRTVQPASLHSYFRGRGVHTALSVLTTYLKKHRTQFREPKTRGLWLFRGDVKSYSDSIDLSSGAQIWTDFRAALSDDLRKSGTFITGVERGVHLSYLTEGGSAVRADRGLPTGSPLNPLFCNLHLMGMDRDLEKLDGIYLRYGDDILWASPSQEVFGKGVHKINECIHARKLSLNAAKARQFFWSGSGFRGSTRVEYLGASVSFGGQVSLTREKRAEFKQQISALAKTIDSWRTMFTDSPDAWQKLVVDRFKDFQKGGPSASPYHDDLLRFVNDRAFLLEIDRAVDLRAAETATHLHGPRAFRHLPPRKLRAMGLESFVNFRNKKRG